MLGLLSFLFFLPLCANEKTETPPRDHLVWADEFNQPDNSLPDPAKWKYEEGYIRNSEAQYYAKERQENARIENGMLVIEARKESIPNATTKGPQLSKYTSAALESRANWTYGRIEARIKLPAGVGIWPAFWMLGANMPEVNWPHCGEIDIAEFWGDKPGFIQGTVHYGPTYPERKSKGGKIAVESTGEFHVYAIDWTAERITFHVDGKSYFQFDVAKADHASGNPFRKPFYLLLNFALGGEHNSPVDNTILPQRMTVDYVRVYQK